MVREDGTNTKSLLKVHYSIAQVPSFRPLLAIKRLRRTLIAIDIYCTTPPEMPSLPSSVYLNGAAAEPSDGSVSGETRYRLEKSRYRHTVGGRGRNAV